MGERLAEQFYLEKGFSIVHQNYRYQRAEVDLVVQKKSLLVLVEVKTRTGGIHLATEALTPNKLTHMERAVEGLLDEIPAHSEIRFDLLAYHLRGKEVVFEYIKDLLR